MANKLILPPKILERDKMLQAAGVNFVFRTKAEAVLSDIRGHGLPLVVVEVLRSKTRAALMKITGKSKIGTKSKHCIGRAADMAWYVNGKITWDVPRDWWVLYGKAAKAHGLAWGDDWRFKDTNHIEL